MINWEVRIKNPTFWLAIVPASLLLLQLVLDLFGVKMDFTELGEKLKNIINAVFAILTLIGITADPTTAGVGDSKRAMTYVAPYNDNEANGGQ